MSYNIVFAGTPEFAVPSLQALIDDPAFNVQLVISQPDKPVGRKQTVTASPVKKLALQHDLAVWTPDNINKELNTLSAMEGDIIRENPDYFIVVAYGQIISQQLLDWPSIAPINVHASLLPRWRGASPIQHAILAGDTESGVTIQRMVKALDAGDILSQSIVPLDEEETAQTLHDRLAQDGAELLLNTLKQDLQPVAQDEGLVTTCHKLTREDGEIDASHMDANEIDRHIRALNPWPGVTVAIEGHQLKVLAASLQEVSDSIAVPCAHGSVLHISQVQPAGKTPMSAADWQRGISN